jgi:succinate dehydrogenase/fumarate reductase flavoprotein subunit
MAVEVGPMAHYHMGGVRVDSNMETRVEGLYAAGEAVGGASGANRLSGNAITEAFVFGARAGAAAAAAVKHVSVAWEPPLVAAASDCLKELRSQRRSTDVTSVALQTELQYLMWDQAGPFRTGEKLAAALARIRKMKNTELANIPVSAESLYNLDLQDWLELRAMLATAEAVVSAALARKESRGAHQRDDFPNADECLLKNQVMELKNGELSSEWIESVSLDRREPSHG